jgi:O-antigen ligase
VSLLGDLKYFVPVLFNSMLLLVLGAQCARSAASVRRLVVLLSAFGVIVAIHSILQASLGITLFASAHWADYLATVSDYRLGGTGPIRAGSFLVNPDTDGNFLAMIAFLPAGLAAQATRRNIRVLYIVETALIVVGLFYTYSAGSMVAAIAGIAAFIVLLYPQRALQALRLLRRWRETPRALRAIPHKWKALSRRWHIIIIAGACVALAVGVLLRRELGALAKHATAPHDLLLRVGAWETGLHVIVTHPLIGIGLSLDSYLARANPYRAPLQTIALTHPHNSFIEIAALAGLPVGILFIVIMVRGFRRAMDTYRNLSGTDRALYAGAIAALVELTANSLFVNGWTIAPIAIIGWLLMGAVASPLGAKLARRKIVAARRTALSSSLASLGGDHMETQAGGV